MKIGQCKAAVQLQRRAADDLAGDGEDRSGIRRRLAEYEAACGASAPKPR